MDEEYCRIMIIDDEPAVAGITHKILAESIDAPIDEIHDPVEALRHIETEEYAIALTDLQMPQMDGLEFARKAKDANKDIIVIMVTAFATREILLEALNQGCIWKVLEKPWNPEDLANLVHGALDVYEESVLAAEAARKVYQPTTVHRKQASEPEPEPVAAPDEDAGNKIRIRKGAVKGKPGPGGIRIRKRPNVRIKGKGPQAKKQEDDGEFRSDRYVDLEKIAEGGSGVICKAHDTLLGMPVAIKFLAEHIANDKISIAELFAEARLAMQLSHKHIVRLHNIEEYKGTYYLVMEYIDGITLRDSLTAEGVFSKEVLMQVMDICDDAVSYAHRREIYHRDLKPDNIMLTRDGVLKIIDYGLACLAGKGEEGAEYICGTPYYISPEELDNKPTDGRSDMFSLGIMAHELYTGQLPFKPGDEGCDMHEFVPRPLASLPLKVQMVFNKVWMRDPDQRYPELHDFVKALRAALEL
jgi:CheY-like chemotaxis protein